MLARGINTGRASHEPCLSCLPSGSQWPSPEGGTTGPVQALHSWVFGLSLSHGFRTSPTEVGRQCVDCLRCEVGIQTETLPASGVE